jgi:hypothetical protein
MLPELVTVFLQIFKPGSTVWVYVYYIVFLYLPYNSQQLIFVAVLCCRKATVRSVDVLYPLCKSIIFERKIQLHAY